MNTTNLDKKENFPNAELKETESIEMSVSTFNGGVIIDFGRPVKWFGLQPDQAREIAASIIEKADLAEGKK